VPVRPVACTLTRVLYGSETDRDCRLTASCLQVGQVNDPSDTFGQMTSTGSALVALDRMGGVDRRRDIPFSSDSVEVVGKAGVTAERDRHRKCRKTRTATPTKPHRHGGRLATFYMAAWQVVGFTAVSAGSKSAWNHNLMIVA
jgi:hypothetical protein